MAAPVFPNCGPQLAPERRLHQECEWKQGESAVARGNGYERKSNSLRQQGRKIPLSRFPQGQAGAGRVPPTAQKARLPPQEGFQSAPLKSPLRHPPISLRRKESFMACGSKEDFLIFYARAT